MSRSALSRRTVVAGGVSLGLLLTGVGNGLASAAPPASGAGVGPGNGWVTSTMALMTLEEKVGQLFIQNVYGKDASAFYDLHGGLRILRRGEDRAAPVVVEKNDTFVEELEEFAAACRGQGQPEVGGDYATVSLAVVRAGILSAREGRRVEVAEILKND